MGTGSVDGHAFRSSVDLEINSGAFLLSSFFWSRLVNGEKWRAAEGPWKETRFIAIEKLLIRSTPMKTVRVFILASSLVASLPSGALKAQAIDSPGPGYRAQAEQFSPKKAPPETRVEVGAPIFLFRSAAELDWTAGPKPPPSRVIAPFSEPIRLFDAAPAPKRLPGPIETLK
jgi:hypothetical protein